VVGERYATDLGLDPRADCFVWDLIPTTGPYVLPYILEDNGSTDYTVLGISRVS
jgi:hypothetical protein